MALQLPPGAVGKDPRGVRFPAGNQRAGTLPVLADQIAQHPVLLQKAVDDLLGEGVSGAERHRQDSALMRGGRPERQRQKRGQQQQHQERGLFQEALLEKRTAAQRASESSHAPLLSKLLRRSRTSSARNAPRYSARCANVPAFGPAIQAKATPEGSHCPARRRISGKKLDG